MSASRRGAAGAQSQRAAIGPVGLKIRDNPDTFFRYDLMARPASRSSTPLPPRMQRLLREAR
ncbi:MAG: hypothetical protein ACLGHA_10800, partial [Gammaproteobacteria bacterium]